MVGLHPQSSLRLLAEVSRAMTKAFGPLLYGRTCFPLDLIAPYIPTQVAISKQHRRWTFVAELMKCIEWIELFGFGHWRESHTQSLRTAGTLLAKPIMHLYATPCY